MADLQPPVPADETFCQQSKRVESSYTNLSDRFVVARSKSRRNYGIQYSHLYFTRLMSLRPRVEDSAKAKWGGKYILVKELKDLKVGEMCIIIGTLFKKLSLRPNILKEFSEKHKLAPQPSRAKYSCVNDELILEDTIQRISLCGNFSISEMTTGVVVALLGSEMECGKFEVDEMCFAGIPQVSVPLPLVENNRYVVLVSGLNIGSAWCDCSSIQIFIDFICGQIGSNDELCSSISRVIIAGNSLSDCPVQSDVNKENKVRFTSRNYTADTVEAMAEFDQLLSQLVSSVSCDLMAGSHDPTNYQLPHQPLHKCMFPCSSRFSGFNRVSNPYNCQIDGIEFLGMSGENVDDVVRCTDGLDPLAALQLTLEWNHIAPTAPDTLGCYPYGDDDPFIIRKCPQVYFVGNQKHYQHKLIKDGSGQQSVLLVCIPSFDATHSAVLVNLRTLQTEEVCFSTSLLVKPNPNLEELPVERADTRDLLMELESDDEL